MIDVIINQIIKDKLPDLTLGCIACDVNVEIENSALWQEIDEVSAGLEMTADLSEISSNPAISASRKAYKACGKDPSRYRLSSEALMRRVVKGNKLFQINNVVDVVNLISLKTGMSIGGYDLERISGKIFFDIGAKDEPYQAIGRGDLNIEYLPLFRDSISPFGSPTSDSVRTSVGPNTKKFLMIVIGFSGYQSTQEAITISLPLLEKYCLAKNIETRIIR
jgi:DNA/RNA-binding domain of Phe-tRNA-synthetase-like protein